MRRVIILKHSSQVKSVIQVGFSPYNTTHATHNHLPQKVLYYSSMPILLFPLTCKGYRYHAQLPRLISNTLKHNLKRKENRENKSWWKWEGSRCQWREWRWCDSGESWWQWQQLTAVMTVRVDGKWGQLTTVTKEDSHEESGELPWWKGLGDQRGMKIV